MLKKQWVLVWLVLFGHYAQTRFDRNSNWFHNNAKFFADITTFDVTLLQGVLTTMGNGMGVTLCHFRHSSLEF